MLYPQPMFGFLTLLEIIVHRHRKYFHRCGRTNMGEPQATVPRETISQRLISAFG